jgi:branched-chain amino acid transport system ATP-binding protein
VVGLVSGYGKIRVLNKVDMTIGRGEIVSLLGPNGAGKTTLLRSVSGLLPWHAGDVEFDGKSLRGLKPHDVVRRGLSHVIEGHRVFTQLTVLDNLFLAGYHLDRRERQRRVAEALAFFPELEVKTGDRGGSLSGGQQQMLAVAQGLVGQPQLLMLDEPSAGLSPVLVDRVLNVARRLRDESGVAILLVEQLVDKALAVADRIYALAGGKIVIEAPADEPGVAGRIEEAYFGKG